MSILIGILIGLLVLVMYLVTVQQKKIEKLDKNQAIMLGYFDKINTNEQTLRDSLQKLYNEFKRTEEKVKVRYVNSEKKDAV